MKSILLVDDEPEVLGVLGALLNKFGYDVVQKTDAASALSALREGAHVDLVITDHRMPGMNGSEFVAVLRRDLPSVPIIILTAYGDVETYVTSLSRGVFEYIHKPVKARDLERIVKTALDSSESHASGPGLDP